MLIIKFESKINLRESCFQVTNQFHFNSLIDAFIIIIITSDSGITTNFEKNEFDMFLEIGFKSIPSIIVIRMSDAIIDANAYF